VNEIESKKIGGIMLKVGKGLRIYMEKNKISLHGNG